MPVIFFENCSAFGKICQSEILPISQKWSQKFIGMIFHALMLLYLTFWGEIFFWPKIWPSLAKFGPIFGVKFFLLSRQEGICQYELNPKVWHFYPCQFKSYSTMCFQTIQGQCLFDLAAFKITNWSKRASNHIVWVPSIIFNLSLTLLDESGPYSSFEDRQ